MNFIVKELRIETVAPIQVIDLSAQVRALVAQTGVSAGLVTLISHHTTAFVSINEFEPGLQADMVDFLTRIAPPSAGYRHDVAPVDDRLNAHSHLVGLCLTASQSIPIVDGRLLLGAWQSILFIELDGPRLARTLHLHVIGNGQA